MIHMFGEMKLTVVPELVSQPVNPAEFFPGLTTSEGDADWRRLHDAEPDGIHEIFTFNIQSFVIECSHAIVLVDACVGSGKRRTRPHFNNLDDAWMKRLVAAGYGPEAVTSVVLTHLHVDHVGWCTRLEAGSWTPTFPVRHFVHADEWRYWNSEEAGPAIERTGDYMGDSIFPLQAAGLLTLVQPPTRLCEHVVIRAATGHTPGHVCVEATCAGATAILVGDLLHHPLQTAFPDIGCRYCVDSVASSATRRALLTEFAAREARIFPTHFRAPGGRIVARGDAFTYVAPDPSPPLGRADT